MLFLYRINILAAERKKKKVGRIRNQGKTEFLRSYFMIVCIISRNFNINARGLFEEHNNRKK